MSDVKRCARCKIEKSVEEFYMDQSRKDGLCLYCSTCISEKRVEYLARPGKRETANAQARERLRELRKGHEEEVNARNREWYHKHKEEVDERKRKYRADHREDLNKRQRERNAIRYVTDQGYKEWWLQRTRNRRAFKCNGGIVTAQEWSDLKQFYKHTCLCCGKKEPVIKLTQDHVVPLSIGGLNVISNIQPLCFSCNSLKHTQSTDYRRG